MKIGIVSPYNLFVPGGVQEAVEAYYREFKYRGYDVRVIAPKPKVVPENKPKDFLLLGQVKKINTPFATTVQIGAANNKEIDHMLEREQFDILHFHEPWMPLLPVQILGRSKAVNIGTLHAKMPSNFFSKSVGKAIIPYTKSALKKLQYVTAVSDLAGDYTHKIVDKPYEIIPNGIDLGVYNPKAAKVVSKYKNKKTILYVGRLEKRKGVIYLVHAFKQLQKKHKDVHLIIAGEGPKRKTLEEYVARYELNNVEFMGQVSHQDKLDLMKTADLFCSPAIFGESFGIVLLEVMAMGATVVAGNNPGYTSVMKNRGVLSLVDPANTQNFCNKLELFLFDEDLRKIWLDWASQYVKQYDYKFLADRYVDIYNEKLKANGKEPKA